MISDTFLTMLDIAIKEKASNDCHAFLNHKGDYNSDTGVISNYEGEIPEAMLREKEKAIANHIVRNLMRNNF